MITDEELKESLKECKGRYLVHRKAYKKSRHKKYFARTDRWLHRER